MTDLFASGFRDLVDVFNFRNRPPVGWVDVVREKSAVSTFELSRAATTTINLALVPTPRSIQWDDGRETGDGVEGCGNI